MMKKATGSKPTTKTTKSKYKRIDEIQLKCAFEMFDKNRDGKLTIEEMKHMLSNLGIDVSDKMITRIVREASKSDTTLISEQDFLTWFSRFKTPKEDDVEADLKAAFMVFDKDNNGFITRDELKSAMQIMGESLTDRDLDDLLHSTDLDQDGRINYEEFIKTLL